jgi:nicotinamidase-related amidase
MKTALLLVDIQNDYFPGGKMELEGAVEAGLKAQQLLDYFRDARLGVLHMQHISASPRATFFLPGTAGVNIHASVAPLESEPVFLKHYPNSFRDTQLLEVLKAAQVERLVIGGMMTHMCVDATTRAAFDNGFECWVAHDACATRVLTFQERVISASDVHASFLAALKAVYAKVLRGDEIIEQLTRA